ncbi:P-loop containing nucleoside triphosphate hydrolase protein [Epithele typhae]|uniref:P-loop containing nucleoside triphosphate hydrolase protein n=1 Tax=Epithele typhae TaxID=378194 RepID=UPI0020085558|nr:P-loop containing nucleoside triphosphate hydrolase protein [Epithele typhae]KAH9913546.1 P-loop containing nucleoside triphosphate hydrolase protein [Epithele typhae]
MDTSDIIQTVLAALQSRSDRPGGQSDPTAEANNTRQTPTQMKAPGSLPEAILVLLSTAAIRDWLILLVIGAFFETIRRSLKDLWTKAVERMWVTAVFAFDDDASDWIMHWLSQRKVFQHARNVENMTKLGRLGRKEDGEEPIAFVPARDMTYSFWYKRHFVRVSRSQEEASSYYKRPKDMLELRVLSWRSDILRDILLEARRGYKKANECAMHVYVSDGHDEWKHVATQDKRPLVSVILDPGVMELVLHDARDFLASKQWHPHRRGYLLYGAPGAGKTSLIHCIAGELGLHVYILSLTVAGLDDNSLKALTSHLPRSCVVLIEDIDAAFTRTMKRDIADPEAAPRDGPTDAPASRSSGKEEDVNRVTLSGLLNALDGIAAQEGRILFATTNDISALDPALLRPGRLDLHVEFKLASAYQAEELFKRFYATPVPSPSSAPRERIADEAQSPSAARPDTTPPPAPTATAPPAPTSASQSPEDEKAAPHGSASGDPLAPEEVAALAAAFAAAVPPRAFSMATLQGFLMAYKERPRAAVADVPAWVARRRGARVARESDQENVRGVVPSPRLASMSDVGLGDAATASCDGEMK